MASKLGHPKYNIGDIVSFKINDDVATGEIWTVDAYGTFFDDKHVCYDIHVNEWEDGEPCLVKHIREEYIIESEVSDEM